MLPVLHKPFVIIKQKIDNERMEQSSLRLTLMSLGFLRVDFWGRGGQFDTPFIFQEELI